MNEPAGFHPGHNAWIIALTVTMATFMEVLDTSIANVALPHIAGGLSATNEESTWVLTSYLVSNAIILPISGWLATRVGRKRFYMSCVALFTATSFMCGIAPTLGSLIFFRVLQGLGGGGLAPSEQSILADTFEPSRRGMAFAVYGMAVVLAPAIGPTLGGFITDHGSWRWIFFINVPVGIVSMILTARVVTDPPWLVEQRKKAGRVDYIGLGLVTLGLGTLQVVLDKGQEDDWFGSTFITVFVVVAGLSLAAFVVWEVIEPNPVVDLHLLKGRNFAISTALMFVLGFVLFSTTVLLPQFVQLFMGYSAEQAGLVLTPGAALIIFVMPIVGVLVSRVQARWLVLFGFVVLSLALWRMTRLSLEIDFRTAVMWRIFQAGGLAFLFIPINTVSYVGVPREKSNEVSGMLNLARNIGGSVGIAFFTTYVARQSQRHQDYLSAHVTASSHAYQSTVPALAQALVAQGKSAADSVHLAQARLYGELIRQSAVLSYVDLLVWMMIATAVIAPLALLLRPNVPGRAPVAH